ncbi:MAG: hypothetical protein GX638_06570, partial [Crenarchaeota archaeon]|nr:hypothetical protein [Thermoproteota archaeon]
MPKYREPKHVVSSYFYNLSMLENNTAALYVCLSEKVDTSQAQSILKEIAIDSQKNNSLLKDLNEKILKPNVKSIDN